MDRWSLTLLTLAFPFKISQFFYFGYSILITAKQRGMKDAHSSRKNGAEDMSFDCNCIINDIIDHECCVRSAS